MKTRFSCDGDWGSTNWSSFLTNQNGEFSLTIVPGKYTIHISATGFSNWSQDLTLVDETEPEPQDFVLQLAEIRQTVTITESAGYDLRSGPDKQLAQASQ